MLLTACQGPAVKRGQRDISSDDLPLACLTIGVEGGSWSLERIVFENAKTHRTAVFILNKAFDSSHPDYPTAVENEKNVLCMAIVHLSPGEYFIRKIEFSPSDGQGAATTEIDFGLEHGYRFRVLPDSANYLGTFYIAPDWREVAEVLRPKWGGSSGQFSARFRIVSTQLRDKKWAKDVIPAMGKIPFVFGNLDLF